MSAKSNKIKVVIFYRFRIKGEESTGFIRFNEVLDMDCFEHLGSEKWIERIREGS